MTKTFLVTYDLKRPEQNYSDLYDAIKSEGDWQHPLESTWMVKTNPDNCANLIYKNIKPTMSEYESLFIVDITGCQRSGWISKNTWKWLKE